MELDSEELKARIHGIFHPEPDYDRAGMPEWYETPPLDRLTTEYMLDTSYWKPFEYGSMSALNRTVADKEDQECEGILRSLFVPRELFMGSFRLLGESAVFYHGKEERKGPYQFYPAILMSTWAAFEAFVRIHSELLVKAVPSLPEAVRRALLEQEETINKKGAIRVQRRPRPLLQRYWWLLRFGYGVEYDRGSKIWQMADASLRKRNGLVHYEHSEMPVIRASELWQHLEAILLVLIGPSVEARLTIMSDLYDLYGVLIGLQPLIGDFEERPLYRDFPAPLNGTFFPCPFKDVDDAKFPSMETWSANLASSKRRSTGRKQPAGEGGRPDS